MPHTVVLSLVFFIAAALLGIVVLLDHFNVSIGYFVVFMTATAYSGAVWQDLKERRERR
jgi:hypothetical protein